MKYLLTLALVACGGPPLNTPVVPENSPGFVELIYGCNVPGTDFYSPDAIGCELNKYPVYAWAFKHKAPITVQTTTAIDSTIAAVDYWNTEIGFELFRVVPVDHAKPDITVTLGMCPDDLNGYTEFKVEPYRHNPVVLCFWERYDTLVHELGHALGLAHDPDNRRSVMYPNSSGRLAASIEPLDLNIIRWLYR